MDDRPLLLRLARAQEVPAGQPTKYDSTRDELLILEGDEWVPAIDSPAGAPRTKKADVETGEDTKDRW